MLGTGNATVSHIYNTCFVLATSTTQLLVDAGGGNGILAQLRKANISIDSIHHLFVTHAHTDHILGVIWIVRMVAQCKGYQGRLHVYGNDKVMSVVRTIIDMVLAKKQLDKVDERVVFYQLTDGEEFDVGDMRLTCFDIHSNKEKQFGFRALLPHSVSLACLGDEPYNPINRPYVEHADWMMCEAFCLYAQPTPLSLTRNAAARLSTRASLPHNSTSRTLSSITPRRRLSIRVNKLTPKRPLNSSKAGLLCRMIWRK